jgi:predicted nucleotidyltransferase
MKAANMFNILHEQIKTQTSFIAMVGSHNYNLADSNSDYDFKLFIYPTFMDLYNGAKKNGHDVKIKDCDLKTTDIRKLKDCLVKSSFNFAETFFSDDIFIPTNENEELDKANKEMINFFIHNREGLAALNVRYLIKTTKSIIQSRTNAFTNNGNYKAAAEAYKNGIMLGRYLTNLIKHEEDPFLNTIKFSKSDAMREPYFQMRQKAITERKILSYIDLANKDLDKIIEEGKFEEREKDHVLTYALENVLQKGVAKRVQVELNNKYSK